MEFSTPYTVFKNKYTGWIFMKKAWFLSLALTLTLTLTACGNSDAALRQENEALRQQILALEAERDNLTKENKDLTEENAALDDTAPESGDDEANPIDRFFEGVDVLSLIHI